MKHTLERLFIIGAFLIAMPYSASAIVTFDLGYPVSHSPSKNEKMSESGTGYSTTYEFEDTQKEATGFSVRGKVDLFIFSFGLGVTSLTDKHELEYPDNSSVPTNEYQFDTSLYELLLGLSLPYVDIGTIIGVGSKTFKINTFSTSSSDSGSSLEVTQDFPVISSGLYLSLNSINILGPLSLRLGVSYQFIVGTQKIVDITDAYTGSSTYNPKFQYEVDPSASVLMVTLGIGF